MFGKIIPMDMLAQMPLHFVHRLRDIRIKQIEEANKQQEIQMAQMQNDKGNKQRNMNKVPNHPALRGRSIDYAMFNGTPFDDIIDELT